MGRPKALLYLHGRTFLENILDAIGNSSIQHVVVVLGYHRELIEQTVAISNSVFNPNYEEGMVTSFQAGIRALPPDAKGTALFLVDHPVVDSNTIETLISKLSPNKIVLPTFEGRRGHPVLFGSGIFEEILAIPSTQGANIVVRRDPDRVIEVPVQEPGVLIDIDTPGQLQKLLEQE